MKFRDVGLCLVGGSILYVTMAACARPAGGPPSGGGRAGAGGTVLHNGSGGGGGAPHDSGIGDALTDPVPSASADPLPGTRLKPRFRAGEDGAKEYLAGAWFDSERGEDCSFMVAADGKTRCLPRGAEFIYYSDANCQTPMIMLESACAPPKYGTSLADSTCALEPGATRVYAVGPAMTPSGIFAKAGASCFSLGAADPGYHYYGVGAEVSASAFVASTLGHD